MIDTAGMQVVPTHRHSHAAVVYGQSMYIFGGKNLKRAVELDRLQSP
jgi:Kelch motif